MSVPKYALLLPLLMPRLALAQASSPTLSWTEVLAAVEAANPELAAARAKAEAALGRVPRAWLPPNPTLEFERMESPVGQNPLDAPERSWIVRQELALPPALYWMRQAAARAAGAEAQRTLAKRGELSARARAAFAALRLSWVERELLEESITVLRRAARATEAKLAAGRSGQSDALRAQTELSRMLGLGEAAAGAVAAAEAELSALMGRPPGPLPRPEPVSSEPPPALEEVEKAALAGRPELRAASAEGARAAAAAKAAKAQWLPMLTAGYRRRSAPISGRTHDAMLGFSLPLWFKRPASMVREAEAERLMAEAEIRALRLETAALIRSAHARLAAALRLAEVYRGVVLPQAEAALATAEKAYASDRGSFLDFLDAQRTLIDLALEREKTLADAETRRAELARAVGKEL